MSIRIPYKSKEPQTLPIHQFGLLNWRQLQYYYCIHYYQVSESGVDVGYTGQEYESFYYFDKLWITIFDSNNELKFNGCSEIKNHNTQPTVGRPDSSNNMRILDSDMESFHSTYYYPI